MPYNTTHYVYNALIQDVRFKQEADGAFSIELVGRYFIITV